MTAAGTDEAAADVLVVGGGPNGSLLAGELRLAGACRSALDGADRVPGQAARVLDQRGLYGRVTGMRDRPESGRAFMFGALPVDLGMPTEDPLHGLRVRCGRRPARPGGRGGRAVRRPARPRAADPAGRLRRVGRRTGTRPRVSTMD